MKIKLKKKKFKKPTFWEDKVEVLKIKIKEVESLMADLQIKYNCWRKSVKLRLFKVLNIKKKKLNWWNWQSYEKEGKEHRLQKELRLQKLELVTGKFKGQSS